MQNCIINVIILIERFGKSFLSGFMEEERKKKRVKIAIIVFVILLTVIAIVEAGVLLSMRAKLDKITNDYNQIQERLENS